MNEPMKSSETKATFCDTVIVCHHGHTPQEYQGKCEPCEWTGPMRLTDAEADRDCDRHELGESA